MLLKLAELTKRPWLLFCATIPLIAVASMLSTGWLQADEHYRSVEPAFKLVHGYATLPWELADQNPVVSWLLGFLLSPALHFTKFIGISSAAHDAWALRFLSGIVGALRIPPLLFLYNKWSIRDKHELGSPSLLLCFAVFFPLLWVRTSQENWAATALIWALLFFEKSTFKGTFKTSLWQSFALGFFISLATSLRLQLGLSLALLGIYSLFLLPHKRFFPQALMSAIGVAVGLFPLAAVDFYTTGTPFLPAINYFKYAFAEEGGNTIWGSNPWHYYFTQYLAVFFPPLCVPFAAAIFKGLQNVRPLLIVVLSFVAVHFALPHKETRYMAPILPLLLLATLLGFEHLKGPFWTSLFDKMCRPKTVLTVLIVSIGLSLAPLNPSHKMFAELGRRIQNGTGPAEIVYVADSKSSPPQFYLRQPQAHFDQWGLQFFDGLVDQILTANLQKESSLQTHKDFLVAAYRVHLPELKKWEKICSVEFDSSRSGDRLLNTLLEKLGRSLGNRRTDAILTCPRSILISGRSMAKKTELKSKTQQLDSQEIQKNENPL
jgi:hypothetical protein